MSKAAPKGKSRPKSAKEIADEEVLVQSLTMHHWFSVNVEFACIQHHMRNTTHRTQHYTQRNIVQEKKRKRGADRMCHTTRAFVRVLQFMSNCVQEKEREAKLSADREAVLLKKLAIEESDGMFPSSTACLFVSTGYLVRHMFFHSS